MGIRMLHRRTASAQASTGTSPCVTFTSVPVFAADASTARIPVELAVALRGTVADLRRGHLTAALTAAFAAAPARLARLARPRPRPHPARTFNVFVATATAATTAVSERPDGSAP